MHIWTSLAPGQPWSRDIDRGLSPRVLSHPEASLPRLIGTAFLGTLRATPDSFVVEKG